MSWKSLRVRASLSIAPAVVWAVAVIVALVAMLVMHQNGTIVSTRGPTGTWHALPGRIDHLMVRNLFAVRLVVMLMVAVVHRGAVGAALACWSMGFIVIGLPVSAVEIEATLGIWDAAGIWLLAQQAGINPRPQWLGLPFVTALFAVLAWPLHPRFVVYLFTVLPLCLVVFGWFTLALRGSSRGQQEEANVVRLPPTPPALPPTYRNEARVNGKGLTAKNLEVVAAGFACLLLYHVVAGLIWLTDHYGGALGIQGDLIESVLETAGLLVVLNVVVVRISVTALFMTVDSAWLRAALLYNFFSPIVGLGSGHLDVAAAIDFAMLWWVARSIGLRPSVAWFLPLVPLLTFYKQSPRFLQFSWQWSAFVGLATLAAGFWAIRTKREVDALKKRDSDELPAPEPAPTFGDSPLAWRWRIGMLALALPAICGMWIYWRKHETVKVTTLSQPSYQDASGRHLAVAQATHRYDPRTMRHRVMMRLSSNKGDPKLHNRVFLHGPKDLINGSRYHYCNNGLGNVPSNRGCCEETSVACEVRFFGRAGAIKLGILKQPFVTTRETKPLRYRAGPRDLSAEQLRTDWDNHTTVSLKDLRFVASVFDAQVLGVFEGEVTDCAPMDSSGTLEPRGFCKLVVPMNGVLAGRNPSEVKFNIQVRGRVVQ